MQTNGVILPRLTAASLVLTSLMLLDGPARPAAHGDEPFAKDGTLLFNGKNFDGWRKEAGEWMAVGSLALDSNDPKRFALKEGTGILVNGRAGKTVNLITEREFGDLEAHIEFCVPKGSNSGVYFMGRYEIQVLDSFGVEKLKYGDNGGIYHNDKGWEGKPPRVNASKAPGEWQVFDVVFRAPRFDGEGKKTSDAKFVKVVHNGEVIHENVEVNAPTIAAAFGDEKPTGPLMFQGDHGPVAYRNLRVKPLGK
jgi:hypothetical protein